MIAKGAPQKKIGVPDVAAAATWVHGELITGTGAHLNPYAAIVEPGDGRVDSPPHAAISYAACAAEVEVDDETGEVRVERMWQCFDVGRAINPTLVEGQIQGGALMGLGLGVLEACYPYYPSPEHRGGEFGSYFAPGIEGLPKIDTIIIENPSADGPYGAKGISEMANNPQPPAIATAVYDAIGVWVTELPITPERVLRALAAKDKGPRMEGKWAIFDEEISVNTVAARGLPLPLPGRLIERLGLRDVERRPALRVPRRREHPRRRRRAGARLPGELRPGLRRRTHSHEHTEQVMIVSEGELELTVEGETRMLRPGDWAVIGKGVEHAVRTEERRAVLGGALPVPLDHVPDRDRDLVLGPDGGSGHVER